jgi:hypothetical protein
VLLFATLLSTLLHASIAFGEEAFTERVSDRLVTGRLSLPTGEVVGFTVYEGEMFKIRDSAADYFYGLSPYIVDGGDQRVSVKLFKLSERAPGLQSLKLLESLDVTPGVKVAMDSAPGFEVEVVDHRESSPAADSASDYPYGEAYGGAFTVPVSSLLVHGEVRLPNGKVVGFATFEGGMFKLRDEEAGLYYGISPYVADREAGQLELKVFAITQSGPGLESLRLLETSEVTPGLKASIGSAAELEVEITGIRDSGPEATWGT